jgi:heptosyltransferase-2
MIGFQRIFDKYIGFVLITIMLLFKPLKFLFKKKNNKRIAITRIWTLGDTITCLPTLKKLKQEGYKIDVYVSNRSRKVIELSGLADKIISFPKFILKPLYYDYVIDTEPYYNFASLISFYMGKKTIGFSNLYRKHMYNYKIKWNGNYHVSYNFARLLKPLNIKFKPKQLILLKYTKKDELIIDKTLKKVKAKKLIGIHLGMAETAKYRMWKIHSFKELIKKINVKHKNAVIILTGSKSEYEINNKLIKNLKIDRIINLAGIPLGATAYLMTKLKVYISNDTGPMHLSAAMGCKTIGLFGPNLPKRYGPLGKDNLTIYKAKKLKCSPCIIPYEAKFRKCPYKGKCMDLITVDDVYKEVKKMLK